ncbi:MAG: hypothetical protein AAB342_07555 [Chloroflexota bacterium]
MSLKGVSAISGLILFAVGAVLGFTLSGAMAWAEIEAGLYHQRSAESSLKTLRCPLMLAEGEPGTITAAFTNSTEALITASVSAVFSHVGGEIARDEFIPLQPGETQERLWNVGAGELIFKRLILVNILAAYQHKLPTQGNTCGILVFNAPGLSGIQTFRIAFGLSVLSILLGAAFWFWGVRPLAGLTRNVSSASAMWGVFVMAAMLTTLPRWWGLTGFFTGGSLLIVGVIITDFVLFPSAAIHGDE